MALQDLQAFIISCLNNVDPTIDTTAGSPYDVNVIQPILNRLGTDPFTVDIGLFIQTTLNQQFPDMPTKEGDAITDLLIKPVITLWNPIVREITRIANAQSVRDPSILTPDEAAALGANYFATLNPGQFSTGVVRIYFAAPQNINVTPANFITSREGLIFYPVETQGISVSEMLLNLEGTLYYFDINVIAQQAGDAYNIGPDDVVTIANLASATRITNKLAFSNGIDTQTPIEFIDGIAQDLTERSLVTLAGITAKVTTDFTAVTQLAVVGFNDPNMQRDILEGGGLGVILASGFLMYAEPDGQNGPLTSQVTTTEAVNFVSLIGPTQQPVSNFVLTLQASAYGSPFAPGSAPLARDIAVLEVVDPQTLLLAEQVLAPDAQYIVWALRQNTLTLSGIPGGILYPNTPDGTVVIEGNEVHIGGVYDVFVRGSTFDSGTLVLSNITDDAPLLSGLLLEFDGTTGDPTSLVSLTDLVLGVNYSVGDTTYTALQTASELGLVLEILDPPNAGSYRILQPATQVLDASPVLVITPSVTSIAGTFRWRISAEIFIDLVNPRDTKVSGDDLRTVQGVSTVDTISGTDFQNYGVGPDDILQITSGGLIVGTYVVKQVLTPLYTKLELDRSLPATVSGAGYTIYTPNPGGGITLPFVRISSIALLDTSGQPVGTNIPYANPIDVESQGFSNSANGIKADVPDAVLGIVTQSLPSGVDANGLTLVITWPTLTSPISTTFVGTDPMPLSQLVSQINYEAAASSGATAGSVTGTVGLNGFDFGMLEGLTLIFQSVPATPVGLTFGTLTSVAGVLAAINAVIGSFATATTTGVAEFLVITLNTPGLAGVLVIGEGTANGVLGLTPGGYPGKDGTIAVLATLLDSGTRIGILPVAPNVTVLVPPNPPYSDAQLLANLFGFTEASWGTPPYSFNITSRDITSATIDAAGGWAGLRPPPDYVYDVAQVIDGLQIGMYSLSGFVPGDDFDPVPNLPFSGTYYDPLRTTHDFNPEVGVHLQEGSRSLGTARLYFLDPTSFEVNPETVFTYTNPTNGAVLQFFPDPTNNYQRIPSLPNGTAPQDGETGGALPNGQLYSASTDFVQEGIEPGDLLTITTIPIVGNVPSGLADPVVGLNGRSLVISLDGTANKTITFIRDSGAIPANAVTRAGVVSQINAVVGQTIVSLNGANQLVFEPTTSLIIRGGASANSYLLDTVVGNQPHPAGIDTTLPTPAGDVNNNSPNAGTYTVTGVGVGTDYNILIVETSEGVAPVWPTAVDDQQFSVYRAGVQRIVSTTMATQVETASLYYFDVELLSAGTGDQYNLPYNTPMTVAGYRSDGYYLTTDKAILTFSPVEAPKLHVSLSILEVGVNDSPTNATMLLGQNLQVNYDQSALTGNVDSYIRSDTERVVNANPLGRHLIPYFVRYSMNYYGGSQTSYVISDSQAYIQGLSPGESLYASALQQLANNRGATAVDNPLTLIAVIHNFDRSVTVERSEDLLNTGTLAAFFPDILDITQSIG